MKKIFSTVVLALTLLPIASMADSTEAGQKATLTGNNSFLGSVTATNLNPAFTAYSPPMAFCSSCGGTVGQTPFFLNTNQSLNAALVNQTNHLTFAAIQISGFSLQCMPYNPTLAAASPYPGFYPYNPETNGIAGGTITIKELKLEGAAVTVGTLVLPTSVHGGPYVNKATSTLATAYTPTAGSVFAAQITSFNAVPTNAYSNCTVTAVLQ